MRCSRRASSLLALVVLVGAGCGEAVEDDGGAGDSDTPTTDATGDDVTGDDLTGDDASDTTVEGDWVLRSGHLDGEPIALVDGRDVTMSIDGDRIGGTAACNGYGGTVVVGDEFGLGGSFVVGELSWTEMGCEPDVMELEQQFLAVLGEVDSYELADTLSLARAGVGTGLMFDRVAPVEDAALVGATWRLDTLISGDAASNSPGMDLAFLEFSDDGTLIGSTGCRRLEGRWVLQGATVRIPTLSAIDDPAAGVCAPESEALDGDIIAVVESGATVEIEGDRLTLTAPGGDGLSFFADDDGGVTPTTIESVAIDTDGLDPAGGIDGSVVYAARPVDDIGADALLGGSVSFGEDGCVSVDGSVVLWRFGTRWQSEPPAVLVDGHVVADGDRIAAGGGYHDAEQVSRWIGNDAVTDYLGACEPSPGDGVFVIQHPINVLDEP